MGVACVVAHPMDKVQSRHVDENGKVFEISEYNAFLIYLDFI